MGTNNALEELGIHFDMGAALLGGLKTALPFIAIALLLGSVTVNKGPLKIKWALPLVFVAVALYCFI